MRWLIVGIGNVWRGDDAIGLVVAERFARPPCPRAEVIRLHDDLLPLLDVWQPQSRVILVDAVVSGAPPGTLHRVDLLSASPAPAVRPASSHLLALPQLLELAAVLGRLPAVLELVGVEAGPCTLGAPVSAPVRAAVPAAVTAIVGLVYGQVQPLGEIAS